MPVSMRMTAYKDCFGVIQEAFANCQAKCLDCKRV